MTLLIIREEIICLLILIFLIMYSIFYNGIGSSNPYLKLAFPSFLHTVLDLITAVTVNNMDIVPPLLNKVLHILFYISGVLFIIEFFNYVAKLTITNRYIKLIRRISYIPLATYILLSFVLPIEYIHGKGTCYSFGPLVFAGYGIFAVFAVTGIILLITKGKNLETKARRSLFPMMLLMSSIIFFQVLTPELLMTGGGITLINIGLFIYMDNNSENYISEAYWDSTFHVKNRNCFNKDVSALISRYDQMNKAISFVIFDINDLKIVNDRYGHSEGDRFLASAVSVITNNLTHAYNIYRIGGDEFAAIYLSDNDIMINAEIQNVSDACSNVKGLPVPLNIAIGFDSGIISDEWRDIYDCADKKMYANKAAMKLAAGKFPITE